MKKIDFIGLQKTPIRTRRNLDEYIDYFRSESTERNQDYTEKYNSSQRITKEDDNDNNNPDNNLKLLMWRD